MSIKANSMAVRAEVGWTLTQDNGTNLNPTTQKTELSFLLAPNTTTWSVALAGNTTIVAGANTAINCAAFTDLLNAAQTAGNAAGFFIRASLTNTANTGGQIRVGPGDTDPFAWIFAGTDTTAGANTATLNVGLLGAGMMWWGDAVSVSSTASNVKLSNPGTNSVTCQFGVILGP